MSAFAYIGQATTGQEFIDYVASYDFGSVPPSYVVMHHSANPDASYAPASGDPATKWDRNEAGLSSDEIKAKRKPQLDSIMRFYRDTQGWPSGPHLFVDERWIWLFTPMYDVGTHAKSGNSYHDSSGKLHYSIGIEVVGYYGRVGWPEPVQKLLQIAVQSLQARLKNFEIVYTHAPLNRPDLHDGQISFHNDYNKPECPGAIITPDYAIPILATPYQTVYTHWKVAAPCAVFTARDPDSPLASGPDNGMTTLARGALINVGQVQDGWLHVAPNATDEPGIGFIPQSYAQKV